MPHSHLHKHFWNGDDYLKIKVIKLHDLRKYIDYIF